MILDGRHEEACNLDYSMYRFYPVSLKSTQTSPEDVNLLEIGTFTFENDDVFPLDNPSKNADVDNVEVTLFSNCVYIGKPSAVENATGKPKVTTFMGEMKITNMRRFNDNDEHWLCDLMITDAKGNPVWKDPTTWSYRERGTRSGAQYMWLPYERRHLKGLSVDLVESEAEFRISYVCKAPDVSDNPDPVA